MRRVFGPIMQNAYVLRDFDAALDHWVGVMGVGPFFLMEHIGFRECYYQGEPLALDMTVAIAYSGDLQIELIRQHDDAASIYTDFLGRGLEGLQHVGVVTEDLDTDLAELADRGIERVQWGEASNGTRFAYVATDRHPGAMVELIEASPALVRGCEFMRAAAADWDGSDPVRRM